MHIKKSINKKCWTGCREKGTCLCCRWDYKLVQPLWRFLKKKKIELPYDLAIPLLGIYPVRKSSWRRKWQPTPVFLPRKSLGQRNLVGYRPWGRKESDMTERLHFPFLSRVSQTEIGKCHMLLLICGI